MTIEKLKGKRTASRGWVTRIVDNLDTLCEKTPCDYVLISEGIVDLDNKLKTLDIIQGQIEDLLPEKELEADIEDAYNFRQRAKTIRAKASCIGGIPTKSKDQITAKLPKLDLPKFGGNVLEWHTFYEQFEAIVHNNDSIKCEISKFSYLRSLLYGEALGSVSGFALTEVNYRNALDLLKSRYGKNDRIVFAHVEELLTLSVPSKCPVSVFRQFEDKLITHIRCLDSLGIDGSKYGVILTPLILSRLPSEVRLEWARGAENKESDLQYLLDFLHLEIGRRERSMVYNDCKLASNSGIQHEVRKQTPSAAALVSKSYQGKKCALCSKSHDTSKCWKLTKAPVETRKRVISQGRLCFRCLDKNHFAAKCTKKCEECSGNHHQLLCDKQNSNNATVSNSVTGKSTILQTVKIIINGKHGPIEANVLFDTGSNISYATTELIKKVSPKWLGSKKLSYAAFGSSSVGKEEVRNIFEIKTKGKKEARFSVTEVPVICAALREPKIPVNVIRKLETHGVILSEEHGDRSVDILIGLDNYWSLMTNNLIKLSEELVAQETNLGWILSGALPSSHSVPAVTLLSVGDMSEQSIRNFWDLDVIGITENPEVSYDPVLTEFKQNIKHIDNRYHVSLPWRPGFKDKLRNNEAQARSRLMSLNNRLAKDDNLRDSYNKSFREMLGLGMIEEVPEPEVNVDGPIFYLPHHPVVKAASLSTKVRPVFDASARGPNGLSLNDCMFAGPSLIPNLPSILIRFRRWKVAFTADITKAFLQVGINKDDQNVHRFLWNDSGKTKIMRFTRVPFGNKASPFLLNATLQFHLDSIPQNRLVLEMKDNLYVDDLLSGNDNDSDASDDLKHAQSILSEAGMKLDKIGSNCLAISDMAARLFESKCNIQTSHKVLGIKWLLDEDCFTYEALEFPSDLVVTKRVILSTIAKLFDPLGFLAPVVMLAKCLFQEIWKLGLDWDSKVPLDTQIEFVSWLKDLTLVSNLRIPRSFTGIAWEKVQRVVLHGFGDASTKGYGASVYLVTHLENKDAVSHLVMSKSRVAPLKTITLPRLELLGALLCARLIRFVKDSLKFEKELDYACWTDSTVALGWIKGSGHRWKPFVQNRIQEITNLTEVGKWFHCPGTDNPADLVTRGIFMKELLKSDLWFSGPSFLLNPLNLSEDCPPPPEVERELPAKVVQLSASHETFLEIERWSSFTKGIRVVSWCLRFVNNLRVKRDLRKKGELSMQEMSLGKELLLKIDQKQNFPVEYEALRRGIAVSKTSALYRLTPYLDQAGLLRIKGRLQCADMTYEEKHPLIMACSHLSLLITRFQHQLMKHAGVQTVLVALRNEYWIIGGRKLAKRVKKFCLPCQRQDSRACDNPFAPLPSLRVTKSPPFSVVGIDHTGVLYCADLPGKKLYILLITCAVVRAVHLELVDSLNAKDVALALRRMFARRGLVSVIFSDNAPAFRAAEKTLKGQLGSVAPSWEKIAPRAPWWGGWWERLNRPIKSALKKTLGMSVCTRSELETSLHEVEACINSRPLTFVGENIADDSPLTPSHFLIGRIPFVPAKVDSEVPQGDLLHRKQVRDDALDSFWKVWSEQYIRNLPLSKVSKSSSNLKVGSVVIIHEDLTPRLKWRMGRVTKLHVGKDGLTRAIDMRTAADKIVTRPIQRVHMLELTDENVDGLSSASSSTHGEVTPLPNSPPQAPLHSDSPENPLSVTRSGKSFKSMNRK